MTFAFTFTVPGASHRDAVTGQGFFGHRAPSTWLEDLARVAGVKSLTAVEDDNAVDLVTVIGDEDALRFACVAFNLHAEQTPWDTTPTEQGEALERVLAGEPVADDESILAALSAAGIDSEPGFTPSRIYVTAGDDVVALTTNFNREDGGWEAVYDKGGDQYGLEDGPGVNATTAEVVAWVQALQASGWAEA